MIEEVAPREAPSRTSDDRSPVVEVMVSPECVRARIEMSWFGDGHDWDEETFQAFAAELHHRCTATAKLQREYGLRFPTPAAPAVAVIPNAVVPAPAETPASPPVQMGMPLLTMVNGNEALERAGEIIQAAEKAGRLVKSRQPQTSRAAMRKQAFTILGILREHDEMRPREIVRLLPEELQAQVHNPNWIKQRLEWLIKEGYATNRREVGYQCPSFYKATPRESGEKEGHSWQHPLNEVLPWTKGKTFLMFGGQPGLSNKRRKCMEIETSLGLRELRWPELDHTSTPSEKLRELERAGVELVLITRWNRTHITQIMHRAHDLDIPVVRLTRGCNIVQIIEAIRNDLPVIRQVEARRTEAEPLAGLALDVIERRRTVAA